MFSFSYRNFKDIFALQVKMDIVYDSFAYYDNYTYDLSTPKEELVIHHKPAFCKEIMCVCLTVINVVIFFLGFFGNALVIWISGFKMKKTVNTTWYLSLAISDFVFCAFLPFNITQMVMEDWIFGHFMCKFVSFVMFLNMFSSIFLLVIISVDRCVLVISPVWAQNHRTIQKASVVVVLAWLLAIGLSIPSMIFRNVSSHMGRTICYNKYPSHDSQEIVALSRFFAGFVVPLIIIIICYSIIILKLRSNRLTKSTKPFKVMTALIAAFFICWLPYHVFILLDLNPENYYHSTLKIGLRAGTAIASANSFLNPVLYVFMGNDFRQRFKSSMLSKMENAMVEEGRTISRYLSRSSSMDGRASTHI